MNSIDTSSSSAPTIYTPTVTSECGTEALQQNFVLQSDIPTDGSTFIIQDVSTGHVISWHTGDIVLAPISNSGAFRWKCAEHEGFFCFQEPSSAKFLCHDRWTGQLRCDSSEGGHCRGFSITLVSGEGFVMSMLEWCKLRSIVATDHSGSFSRLARHGYKLSDGIIWKFIKSND